MDITKKLQLKKMGYITADELHEQSMKDPEYRRLWEESRPLHEFILSLIRARVDNGLTQKELADIISMKQSAVARIESGEGNPRFKTMQALAKGVGKQIKVTLV